MREVAPFPAVPPALGERWRRLGLRRFGEARADLDVDLGGERRPVVSELLARCAVDRAAPGPAASADEIEALRLGARIEGLLRLALLAGVAEVARVLECAGCGAKVEVALPLGVLADLQREVGAIDAVRVGEGDQALRVRLPAAVDLAAWERLAPGTVDEAAFAARLIVEGTPDPAALPAIDEALAAADPLVDFHLDVLCPECQGRSRVDLDLEGLALDVLAREQARALDAIHRLASAYHWSEAAIVELPPWRRDYYLGRVDREVRR